MSHRPYRPKSSTVRATHEQMLKVGDTRWPNQGQACEVVPVERTVRRLLGGGYLVALIVGTWRGASASRHPVLSLQA